MVSSAGADETVSAENTVTVYNFEVEDWHTYFVGEAGVLVHNNCETVDGHLVGEKGTQVSSKNIWKGKEGHIDIENPDPGGRAGQLHFQDYKGNKYYYNIEENRFYIENSEILAPKSIQKLLEDSRIIEAIKKALKYLGETYRGTK